MGKNQFLSFSNVLSLLSFLFLVGTTLYVLQKFDLFDFSTLGFRERIIERERVRIDVETEYMYYDVNLDIYPNNVCVGDLVLGSIYSNIPNGFCSIFVNNVFLINLDLDASGDYSQNIQMNTSGTFDVVAMCTDGANNYRRSNTENLVVRICDNDGDGIPDEEDPDDDNDGYDDAEELEEGTDPKDPNDHPTDASTCYSYCKSLGYGGGREVSSPGYCIHDAEVYKAFGSKHCCCTTSGNQPTYTCGQGADSGKCAGTCPPTYPYCIEVSVAENVGSCMCVDSVGETGNVAPDWKKGGSMYNEHDLGSGGAGSGCSDPDNSLSTFPNDLKIKSTAVDDSGSHTDSCVDGLIEEWYDVPAMGYCKSTQYGCAGHFGPKSYCRFGACIIDNTLNPTNCAFCSSNWGFPYSFLIDTNEHCTDAMKNLCEVTGQEYGGVAYFSASSCCCFDCL